MSLPPNDPRRLGKAFPGPVAGRKRGVGFRLLPGAVTIWGTPVHQEAHPFGEARMGEAAQTNATVDKAETRYPEFRRGPRQKSVDQILRGLWAARAIPGLSPADHDLYDGVETAEEWYDAACTEDPRLWGAWSAFNRAVDIDPSALSIGEMAAKLPAEQKEAVATLLAGLLRTAVVLSLFVLGCSPQYVPAQDRSHQRAVACQSEAAAAPAQPEDGRRALLSCEAFARCYWSDPVALSAALMTCCDDFTAAHVPLVVGPEPKDQRCSGGGAQAQHQQNILWAADSARKVCREPRPD